MKKIILLYSALFIGLNAFSQKQKISVEGDTIKVDGKAYALIEKKAALSTDMKVKSLSGKLLIQFSFYEFNNPKRASNGNPDGRVTYYEVTFMDEQNSKCEDDLPATKKGIAKFIVNNGLIKDNELDPVAVKNICATLGTKFSKERDSMNGPKVIIIEK